MTTETVGLIRDGGRRGLGMRDQAHHPVHTALELCAEVFFYDALHPQKVDDLSGTGEEGGRE